MKSEPHGTISHSFLCSGCVSLTVFGHVDLGSLVLPVDGGGRRADDIADDVGVVALGELLRARGVPEADLFCT